MQAHLRGKLSQDKLARISNLSYSKLQQVRAPPFPLDIFSGQRMNIEGEMNEY